MQRLYLYNGSMAIIGLVIGPVATFDLVAGQSSISLWLMAVGGDGMVVAAVYETITTDPDDFSINTYALLGFLFAALLCLASAILQLVS
jgi:NAD kinase